MYKLKFFGAKQCQLCDLHFSGLYIGSDDLWALPYAQFFNPSMVTVQYTICCMYKVTYRCSHLCP